jgi:hypothetical protein
METAGEATDCSSEHAASIRDAGMPEVDLVANRTWIRRQRCQQWDAQSVSDLLGICWVTTTGLIDNEAKFLPRALRQRRHQSACSAQRSGVGGDD